MTLPAGIRTSKPDHQYRRRRDVGRVNFADLRADCDRYEAALIRLTGIRTRSVHKLLEREVLLHGGILWLAVRDDFRNWVLTAA